MRVAAVIVAAGRGQRAGGGVAKQWRPLRGRRIADRTVDAFQRHASIDQIVLVHHPDDQKHIASFVDSSNILLVPGGETRRDSVLAGLESLSDKDIGIVLIHDVARPLASQELISNVISALDNHVAAAPALAVTDALWNSEEETVSGLTDRRGFYRAQTPQGFHFEPILRAHRDFTGDADDDVAIAHAAGIETYIVPGEEQNLKVTHPEDLARAEQMLSQTMDIRTGNGFDVHRFSNGDHVTLCGVKIPFTRSLSGHSDADVGMHALCDAIYGALGDGDIGQHFPPSDMKWKGTESRVFLSHAVELAQEKGFSITHCDITLICELPKIGPHQDAMRNALAEIMKIDKGRISAKATTSERLGFTGRGEGIAAIATATLVKI